MSRRAIMSLVASSIFAVGFILTVSTDADAYYRRGVGVYRGGVNRGVVYRGGYYRPGVAVGIGAAAVGAAALGAAAAGAYYAPGYYVAPQCGYYPYPPCY